MLETKISKKTWIKFHKRFANGEQFLLVNQSGKIVEKEFQYFWQEREVYNHILPIIEMLKKKLPEEKLTDEFLYGEHGLVSLLVPIQRAYNSLMNRNAELINKLPYANLVVEDGSVDLDNLEEEGLMPGKILVYRQGAQKPKMLQDKDLYDVTLIESQRAILLNEFEYITNLYLGDNDFKVGFNI